MFLGYVFTNVKINAPNKKKKKQKTFDDQNYLHFQFISNFFLYPTQTKVEPCIPINSR